MFTNKRTISSPILPNTGNEANAKKHYISTLNLPSAKAAQKLSHIQQNNDILPTLHNNHIKSTSFYTTSTITAPITSSATAINSIHTYNISQSFSQLKTSIIARGTTYAKNTLASRRGYVAENFVAESYNIDATINKSSSRAMVPESNQNASPDIIYDNGKQASLKFYKDTASSVKAQTNPDYSDYELIIASDQVPEASEICENLSYRNELKGRIEAAELQRDTADRITATIKNDDGIESMPLSKDNADEIAKAFKVDKNGNKIVDESQLDKALENTGITKKVNHAKFMNELKGIGIAAAIGLGTGFAIGFIVSLAQNGLNPSSLKHAFVAGVHQGGASALTAAGGALIGALTHGATESLAHIIANRMGIDIASEAAKNISTMCSMGVVGTLTTIVFAVINFAILKRQGYNTKECLLRTRNTTALSFSILIVSICLQGAFGGHVGMVVSIVAGVIITGITVCKIFHNKKVFRQITYYSIELCKPELQIA